jgi:hypothetical protein
MFETGEGQSRWLPWRSAEHTLKIKSEEKRNGSPLGTFVEVPEKCGI